MMNDESVKNNKLLKAFLSESLAKGNLNTHDILPRKDVTVVMYFFWQRESASIAWNDFAGALLATWRHCGRLHTVVVSNAEHQCLREFADRNGNVEIQIERSLIPGNIDSMSIDCNCRLYSRFATKFVLIIQNDGFPLRRGLDEFVEKGYDFIGSPYCRALMIPNFLTKILNYCPSNGGFSLRTRRICELAASYWEDEYAHQKFVVDDMSEDLFYTKTLASRKPLYWLRRRQAPSIIAEQFSYEGCFPLYSKKMPFGFHTAKGFAEIRQRFCI